MNPELNNLIKILSTFSDNGAFDCIKIDHYSWSKDSIYRYFEKEFINKHLIREVEIAVENEFLRWDNEDSKRFMIEGLSLMRFDKNIPSSDAWEDVHAFDNNAIMTLQFLIQENSDSDITDIVRNIECLFQDAKTQEDIRLMQIYGRILYELNECSLREFDELKRATLGGR